MKKRQSLESIVKPIGLVKEELISIKGGITETVQMECARGKVRCLPGPIDRDILSVW